jgi:hypothetical protein
MACGSMHACITELTGGWPMDCDQQAAVVHGTLALDAADTLVGDVIKAIACYCSKHVKQWIRTKYEKEDYGFRIMIHRKARLTQVAGFKCTRKRWNCARKAVAVQVQEPYFDRTKLGGDGACQLTGVWFRVWHIKNKTR